MQIGILGAVSPVAEALFGRLRVAPSSIERPRASVFRSMCETWGTACDAPLIAHRLCAHLYGCLRRSCIAVD